MVTLNEAFCCAVSGPSSDSCTQCNFRAVTENDDKGLGTPGNRRNLNPLPLNPAGLRDLLHP